jgi:GNAT superfamily N-acetyltransferase
MATKIFRPSLRIVYARVALQSLGGNNNIRRKFRFAIERARMGFLCGADLRNTRGMSQTEGDVIIRAAKPADGPAYVELVRALAVFANLAPPDETAAARLLEHAFGDRPRYELLVAEVGGAVQGYAAFYETYSTFRALPSLYLEDLFVHARARGRGAGTALMRALGRLAVERGCGRFEWTVLDWNAVGQRFYRSLGARILTEWQVCRVDGDALAALGR